MLSFTSFRLPTFGFGRSSAPIDLPSVQIHDVETSTEKRARTLKHLLRANHANHSIIYHNLQFHNHTPHVLGSAYIFGSTPEHLNAIYDEESKHLEPWHDSPGEVSKDDWREYLGKRNYQRAYIDFFEDQLVEHGYDWKALLEKYLYEGDEPLINNMVSGLGHPLIHLGYAFELNSKTVAIEALALGTCFYNFLHKYVDDPSYSKPSPYSSTSPLEIFEKIRDDKRFDGLFDEIGAGNIEPLFEKREEAVLEYWNAWDISKPKEQFEQSQQAAVALLVAAHEPGTQYDFFMVHLLTTSHAVRILLPLIPVKFQIPLVRQWWLFTVAVYIAQLRPKIDKDSVHKFDLKGRDWKFVQHTALTSEYSLDAHYVKASRSMKEAAETWGDPSSDYLKAAVKFVEEFNGWGGFGPRDVEEAEEMAKHGKFYPPH